jgi:hypothetical protein
MINTGGEFRDFIQRQDLNDSSKDKLETLTRKILQRTDLISQSPSSNCQLVVGEVQSGKTMSFTALIALAHENGFPLVVVLAGTKDQLLIQTSERLIKDLKAEGNGSANPWVVLTKPKKSQKNQNSKILQKSLSIWNELDAPTSFKPTVVLTTLKNRTGIEAVIDLIEEIKLRINLDNYPVLIIDDEGDQAGLNLDWLTEEESTIYSAIGRLRRSLKLHSYVMYTATPQGPLLVNIEDTLSPKYVTLLESGSDYLGGSELFIENGDFTKLIPEDEFTQVFDTSPSAPSPKSLKSALAYYLLALYVAQSRGNPKPISMLIHPSAQVILHNRYEKWVSNLLYAWETILKEPSERIYEKEKLDFFEPALKELKKTTKLPLDFDLSSSLKEIRWWISKIEVRIVNAETHNIQSKEWQSKAGWILIGGNKLERGFTIENLAVTYMPRSTGVGNVDVIQQRGRFFGYKRKYKDLLRGWFFQDHIQAYISYVDHENSIRSQLELVDNSNQRLIEWRRRFLLDPSYKPVRNQVISLGIVHRKLSTFKQHMLFDPSIRENQDAFHVELKKFQSNLKKLPQDNRGDIGNFYSELNLDQALSLLADWPMSPSNRAELDDLIWAIKSIDDSGDPIPVAIVFMDWDGQELSQRIRERSMLHHKSDPNKPTEEQVIANIFQGRSGKDEKSYPGDSEMVINDALTIQVHLIKPFYETRAFPQVYALGLIFPESSSAFITEKSKRIIN